MYSLESFKLCVDGLPRVLADPNDIEARGHMLLGAAYAGTAIENSMLGAAHSAANPLTAHFGIVHGVAVGVMLPHVVRLNAQNAGARKGYAELASAPEIATVRDGEEAAVEALIARLESLLNLAGMPRSLEEAGADPAVEFPDSPRKPPGSGPPTSIPAPWRPVISPRLYEAGLRPSRRRRRATAS